MKVRIYHSTNTRDSLHYRRDGQQRFGAIYNFGLMLAAVLEDKYELAGEVEARSLDEAYHLSQNHVPGNEIAWGDGQQRSSSVGDIFVAEGAAWVVASMGFDLIGEVKYKADGSNLNGNILRFNSIVSAV